MEAFLDFIYKFFITAVSIICTSDALILFTKSRNNKTRKVLAVTFLLWGIVYFYRVLSFIMIEIYPFGFSIMRHNVLIIGNIFVILMFLFPLQVFIPGWMNIKRFFLLYLPFGLLVAIYYAGLALLNESPLEIESYSQFLDNIGQFNVWYRFIFILSNFFYMGIMLKRLYRYEKKYIQWKNENYSDQEYVDIAWMRGYALMIFLIFLCYVFIFLIGGQIPVIIHSLVVILSFSYWFYKGLFYESPYPENFFSDSNRTNVAEEILLLPRYMKDEEVYKNNDFTFESKIPDYLNILQKWMEEERPYLYKDFKLTDVARVLPLNRSYLSRVFNEGYGANFCDVVRSYRVEYAKKLLRDETMLPLYKVAALSGFGSDSAFIRAFKQVTGVTPAKYRDQV